MSVSSLTLWLTVGWLLVSAGILTLIGFLLRLVRYSLGEIVVTRQTQTAAARGYRAREEVG